MSLKNILKSYKRPLSAIGAGLVLLTFVVREAVRDDLKDLITAIDNAQSLHAIRSDNVDLVFRIESLRAQIDQLTNEGSSDDIRNLDADDANSIHFQGIAASLEDLIDRLPEKDRKTFRASLEELNKDVQTIDERYSIIGNEKAGVVSPAQKAQERAAR